MAEPSRSPWRPAVERRALREAAVAVALPTILAAGLVAADPRMWHWFVVPQVLCAILAGSEAVRWFRAGSDPFDPRALIGILGFIAHGIGPLLFVFWDLRLLFAFNPADWRPIIGVTGVVCLAGWLVYLLVLGHLLRRPPAPRPARTLVTATLLPLVAGAAVIGMFAHARFVGAAGAGLTATGMERASAARGLGVLLPFSETVPILVFLTALHVIRTRLPLGRRLPWVLGALTFLIALQVAISGLRGSRSAMIIPTFWAIAAMPLAGIRVRRGPLLASASVIVAASLVYGLYKDYGAATLAVLDAGLTRAELRALAPARTPEYVITADIARVGAQSAVIWGRLPDGPQFDLALGRTYVGGLVIVLPQALWPGRPEGKLREGTIILHGMPAYLAGDRASQVYGLAGEAVMNFGLYGAPFVFAIWAWVVARLQQLRASLPVDDWRALVLPYFSYLAVSVISGDFDNVVVGLVVMAAVPILVFTLASARPSSRTSLGLVAPRTVS